jgi:hypothetical protein
MIDKNISDYLIRCAKFEYLLVCKDISLAQTEQNGLFQVVKGIEWSKLAQRLEDVRPFATFNFDTYRFGYFKSNTPQFLSIKDGNLKWDSENKTIDSWILLVTRSFAQLRNNIAHGNKSHMAAAFTADRTEKFIDAGNNFMNFVANELFNEIDWEQPIVFR